MSDNMQNLDELQLDLDTLNNWTEIWLLKFNVSKCKVLHHGYNNPEYQYLLQENGLR